MKERPILFSGSMVRAIVEGKKTQTRRVVKPQPRGHHWETMHGYELLVSDIYLESRGRCFVRFNHTIPHPSLRCDRFYDEDCAPFCPYGQVGDRLWVREKHARIPGMTGMHLPHYFADGPIPTIDIRHDAGLLGTYPSIHMPRWASRITLEITGVRVERLQDISEEDAVAEGLSCISKDGATYKYGIADRDGLPGNDDFGWHWFQWEKNPRLAYRKLWESINGPGSWAENPWVWVVQFVRCQ